MENDGERAGATQEILPLRVHNARRLSIRVSEPADDYPSAQWRKHRRREISALFASRCEARENEDLS